MVVLVGGRCFVCSPEFWGIRDPIYTAKGPMAGRLVFEVHRLLYHSTPGWRAMKQKKELMAHVGQSNPVSGLGFPVKVLKPVLVVTSSLGSEESNARVC